MTAGLAAITFLRLAAVFLFSFSRLVFLVFGFGFFLFLVATARRRSATTCRDGARQNGLLVFGCVRYSRAGNRFLRGRVT